MVFKSLELNGFKSFSQKTTLEFREGITAIVGPNGSGKSNIIDAIRWLLGEREAKHLRGDRAEDMLFAGTPTKPRVSMGYASIHLLNTNDVFQTDFNEIHIRRQVSRKGTSQYFFNKSEIRLKDIIDFFAKSRLGVKGLIIVNQGNSDLFIKAAPCERRGMIEEILGLKEYQLKKSESERKLKTTLTNLDQTRQLIEELTPRLRILKRQTAKWERREEIERTLAHTKHLLLTSQLVAIHARHTICEQTEQEISRDIAAHQKKLAIAEQSLQALTKPNHNDLDVLRNEEQQILAHRAEFEKELGKIEYRLEMHAVNKKESLPPQHMPQLTKLVQEIRGRLEEIISASDNKKTPQILKTLIAKIDTLFGKQQVQIHQEEEVDLHACSNTLLNSIKECEQALANIQKQRGAITIKFETFNTEFSQVFSHLEQIKSTLREFEHRKITRAEERTSLADEIERIRDQMAQIPDHTQTEQQVPRIEMASAEREVMKLEAELAAIGEIDTELLREHKETEERHTFLSSQVSDLGQATEDLQKLIGELEKKIHFEFTTALTKINTEFHSFIRIMFGGGTAKLVVVQRKTQEEDEEAESNAGIDISVSLPSKRITGLDMLSGGERSLVSVAALFALISISPPPFLVFDEIDAALDEQNAKRFAELLKKFSKKTQFIIVTHNRSTMEAADALYGVTMNDGISKLVSLKLG